MFQGSTSKHSKKICLPPASESLEFKFYNCKHSTELIFKLHPLLIARQISFSTNYPVLDSTATFSRTKFYGLPWISTQAKLPEFDPDRYISFTVDKSGAFCFIYTWTSEDGESIERRGYFIVEPKTIIPVESITLQTYIVRCLGTLDEWKPRLWVSKYCNYNAIHFTPVQERGDSDSAYSIKDHLKLHSNIVSTEIQAKLFSSLQSNLVKIENSICADFSYEIDKGHMVLEEGLRNLCSEWGLLRVVDLVWNHCSYDSTWLRDHPDAGYNLHNSPHLIPAYILDRELHLLSREIGEGAHEARYGVTRQVSHNDPQGYRSKLEMLLRELLPKRAKLEKYFHVNVDKEYSSVQTKLLTTDYTQIPKAAGTAEELRIYNIGTRDGAGIDEDLALKLFFGELTNSSSAGRVESCLANLRQALTHLNSSADQAVSRHLDAAISAVMGGFEWRFINSNGPKLAEICSDSPIAGEYFFHLDGNVWLPDEQIGMQEHASRVLLHNGYVIDWNALKNMAAPDSNVFLRREVVIWGDSCKLNYGEKPEDNPWLWEYMRHYTIMMARLFDGFRIDNCHNTPLHVAEYLLDEARLINPNLLVIAELFTNSMETDNLFINRMGLNLLIRESLVANTPHILGGLIYTFGGKSIGSFNQKTLPSLGDTPLAIFYDVTHDNPTIIDKHSVFDVMPTTALISMTACPTGSCRGYDELVPHMVHVVNEKRKYSHYKEEEMNYGLFKIKRELNRLHSSMIAEGYTEIYVHDVTESVISITRHNPNTLDSYVLITHTSFFEPESAYLPTQQEKHKPFPIPALSLEGQVTEIFLEAYLKRDTSVSFDEDKESINGLTGYVPFMKCNINPNRSKLIKVVSKQGSSEIAVEFVDFPPGAVIVLLLRSKQESLAAANSLRGFAEFQPISRVASITHVEGMNVRNAIDSEISKLGLLDFNFLLYHSEPEERELGGGIYEIPGYGKTVYAGIQGFVTILDRIRQTNDLGHPLCENIRSGNWMMEYTAKRLERRPSLQELSKLIMGSCSQLDKIPRGLKPFYFDLVITSLYDMLMHYCLTHFSPFIQKGSSFLRNLALGSVQLVSDCRSAPLPVHNSKSAATNTTGSLAAGLPHFSAGRMRSWGRDTFIALHGILVVTGRTEEAKQHILSFGSTLRHGMIPNLLAAGEDSRYNCRDAPWWWINSVKLYSKYTGENGILNERVTRVFASDESIAFTETEEEPLSEIIQAILQRHCDVIQFRERSAGVELDRDMTEEGFLVEAFVDLSTGFVCGGSEKNCGTWMDKMGSSEKAGNKGKPATPRNGSAVELVGLCKSVVTWLCELNEGGAYPYEGVDVKCASSGQIVKFSFKAWGERIGENFESKFWIPESRAEAREREGAMKEYINKTGLYKDSFGATQKWADYQLRPNFPIAMVVAPELFTPVNAKIALDLTDRLLLGPLGMRTLDRDDWAYRGSYVMCDSDEFYTAHGFNYHQGPEWLWLTGYFLQAKLHFCSGPTKEEKMEVLRSVYEVLGRIGNCLLNSDWKNLPELTNENGSECAGSCPVQAWSIATFIDTLYTIHNTFSLDS